MYTHTYKQISLNDFFNSSHHLSSPILIILLNQEAFFFFMSCCSCVLCTWCYLCDYGDLEGLACLEKVVHSKWVMAGGGATFVPGLFLCVLSYCVLFNKKKTATITHIPSL